MKIALLGYGKMGRLIEESAIKRGHLIVLRQTSTSSSYEDLKNCDLVIDFSHPSAVLPHVKQCINHQKPLIIGTTGWEKDLQIVQELVFNAQIGCLAAANFSIGVHLFQRLVGQAAALFCHQPSYDVAGVEYHHNQKFDAPSGTAKALSQEIHSHLPCNPETLFTSVRCGHMPGTHEIYFDSLEDTITLSHQARSRKGFAEGAVLAAEWLYPQKGYYTMHDYIQATLDKGKSPCV